MQITGQKDAKILKHRAVNYEADYRLISKWWEAQGWPVIPKDSLPKIGIVVEDEEGVKLAAGWLYQSDSNISWMEWIVGNPDVGFEKRGEALDVLIAVLKEEAINCGKPVIFNTCVHTRLAERLGQHGFQVTDKNATNFMFIHNGNNN